MLFSPIAIIYCLPVQVVMENSHVIQPIMALDALANTLGLGMGLQVMRNKGMCWGVHDMEGYVKKITIIEDCVMLLE